MLCLLPTLTSLRQPSCFHGCRSGRVCPRVSSGGVSAPLPVHILPVGQPLPWATSLPSPLPSLLLLLLTHLLILQELCSFPTNNLCRQLLHHVGLCPPALGRGWWRGLPTALWDHRNSRSMKEQTVVSTSPEVVWVCRSVPMGTWNSQAKNRGGLFTEKLYA